MKHRVAVVTGIPAPYREPVFAQLAQRPEVDLRVFYCAQGHGDVAWTREDRESPDYPRTFLPNATPKRLRRLPFFGYANLSILRELRSFAPDYAVVYGYNQLTHLLTFAHCVRRGIPFALRSDSNVHVDGSTTWRSSLRRTMLRKLVRKADAVLAVGSANRDYWRSYGATEEQIHMAPYAIDNDRVAQTAGTRRRGEGPLRFLYVGRLIPRKGVDLLVEAFNRVADDRCQLTIVGDGSERPKLMAAQSDFAAGRTRWIGKTTNSEALQMYAEADVFVLPSRYEPWGLVVNEAMAAGLPVVADRKVGAAIDLVEDGRTGRLLQELSVDSLAAAMAAYRDAPASALEQGVRAEQRVQNWSFERTVDGFVRAIRAGAARSSASLRLSLAGGVHA